MVIVILALGVIGGMLSEGAFRDGPGAQVIGPQADDLPQRLEDLAESGQWRELWWAIPKAILKRTQHAGPVDLAIFSGACWLAFCIQAAQLRSRLDAQLCAMSLSVVLGGLTVWPTHFFSLWIETRWKIQESLELAAGLRYCILGIGLPEELAKLLGFLPLVPLLLRRRSDLAALMTAACVGLGFAIVENMTYFRDSAGTSVVGRFLTANPFHMTLTGLAGLAVYRAARDPRGWGPNALAMLGLMVFAHGLYDATILLAVHLGELTLLGQIVFVLAVYQFFRELRDLQFRRAETISLTATFLAGVSLVTSVTFVYVSGLTTFQAACDTLAMNVLSLSLMAYVFLREMPETMVTV
jgi:RsiW-degrading membrane proteinase PrsW (M82 family)